MMRAEIELPSPCAAVSAARLERAYAEVRAQLLAECSPDGHWEGELSSSALSTATAVIALALADRERCGGLTRAGARWIVGHQNRDGGWGDTTRSVSNISTTLLCRAALALEPAGGTDPAARADDYLAGACGGRDRSAWARAVRDRYGRDRTFSVPILTAAALAGITKWEEVPALPFELACLPQRLYRLLRLPVVSYALPALIALGIVRLRNGSPPIPALRRLRRAFVGPALAKLEAIQPSHGGFLEATPLVSFVTMSLCGAALSGHPATRRAVGFLERSARADGSWPIDTNLATWVTTLAVDALGGDGTRADDAGPLRAWLAAQQHRVEHPYTGAAPGGWAWTPLEGGVPDADDTAGALVALRRLGVTAETRQAAEGGVRWLLDLQNGDGGWPTFCRGWGYLPFDRSSPDITAHAVRALGAWSDDLRRQAGRMQRALRRGFAFLERSQRPEGSWLPLWFGNQHGPGDENPTYGTARVIEAYRDTGATDAGPVLRARAWLLRAQNSDGAWGGAPGTPSSIEETALALASLAGSTDGAGFELGLAWLCARVEDGSVREPSPIGFYFAKLWYFEKLYPLIFTVGALRRALEARRAASPRGPRTAPGDDNV